MVFDTLDYRNPCHDLPPNKQRIVEEEVIHGAGQAVINALTLIGDPCNDNGSLPLSHRVHEGLGDRARVTNLMVPTDVHR